MYHSLGDSSSNDKIVFEENNDAFYLDITKTKDSKYLIITANSKTASEIYLIDSNQKLR